MSKIALHTNEQFYKEMSMYVFLHYITQKKKQFTKSICAYNTYKVFGMRFTEYQ